MQAAWVPDSLMSLLEEPLERAMRRIGTPDVGLPVSQRRGSIQTEFRSAARGGYAAIESSLRMAAAEVLAENTDLSTDARQSILETAAGHFTLPTDSSTFGTPWNRAKGSVLAGIGGGMSGSILTLLLSLAGLGKKVAGNPETAEKASSASGMSPFAIVAVVGGSALIGVAVHETVWRAKNRRLAEDRLASLPRKLSNLYKAHAEKALGKYVTMIEANVKNADRAREED